MSYFLIIDSHPHGSSRIGYHQKQLVGGFGMMSGTHRCKTFAVGGLSDYDVLKMLNAEKPDVVIGINAGLARNYQAFCDSPCHKVVMWFDEPVSRCCGFSGNEAMMKDQEFTHFIWDGHWRARALAIWGTKAHKIHLAANTSDFPVCEEPVGGGLVFIGTLHSPKAIQDRISTILPTTGQKIMKAVIHHLTMWPYDKQIDDFERLIALALANECRKSRIIYECDMKRKLPWIENLWMAVWEASKTAARVRIIKQALEVAPLTMYADFSRSQLDHATIEETRGMINDWGERLTCYDTSGYCSCDLWRLYHNGRLHINATDPQSVEGGLPYRIFQTAMSGRVLVTEDVIELADCYKNEQHLITYQPGQFQDVLSKAWAKTDDELMVMGAAAAQHSAWFNTWNKRIHDIWCEVQRRPQFGRREVTTPNTELLDYLSAFSMQPTTMDYFKCRPNDSELEFKPQHEHFNDGDPSIIRSDA